MDGYIPKLEGRSICFTREQAMRFFESSCDFSTDFTVMTPGDEPPPGDAKYIQIVLPKEGVSDG